ncbi:MFS transporter [Bifidobacterium vespertilionis]|uniref:MFS transporter n=1 Tax=Bifidobacterium vespertilionis TaxID=2562524 RepID=A0A5J5DYY4_9BIFI|nr:MFS transporter [Bifidobacterium vespertilionis]KAA8822045.1 MFS transporter [Bifidobacterium vespertilionis]KAA8823514.1 MFS transporter [Bifidobacterium vespertilionis]
MAASAYDQIESRPLTGHQKSVITLMVMSNIAEFFDMFLIGFVVSVLTTAWRLTGFEAGTILACSGLGTVIGAIVWGHLADRFGRKRAHAWCIACFVGFTVVSVFLPDRAWLALALLRVGVGIGVGGMNITSIPYVQEFVPARHRGLLSGLVSVFIPLGMLLGAAAQGLVGDDWRALMAFGAIPALLLIWLHLVPESPRYWQLRGRDDKAREALAWALEIPADQVGDLPADSAAEPPSYSRLFAGHGRALAIVSVGSFCFIMGGFAVQSWGQTLLKDAFGFPTRMVALLFVGVSVADMVGRLASAWLADVIGRRATMFAFGVIGAAGCFAAALFHDSGWAFYAAVLVIMTFGDGVFGILNAFGGEQFPNDVRSTALGLGYGIGATAKVIGPAFMGLLVGGGYVAQRIDIAVVTTAFSFFGACMLVGAIVYLFANETRGRELESL